MKALPATDTEQGSDLQDMVKADAESAKIIIQAILTRE